MARRSGGCGKRESERGGERGGEIEGESVREREKISRRIIEEREGK